LFEHLLTGGVEGAELSHLARAHATVEGVGAGAEAFFLYVAGGDDLFAHGFAGGAGLLRAQVAERYGLHGHVYINAVDQRAADAIEVALDLRLAAFAGRARVGEVTAGAGVHGGDEHELGGEAYAAVAAGDGDATIFERLAQCFENSAGKLREFIEK